MTNRDVTSAWVDAVVSLGGDREASERSGADLWRRYGEGHRSYHGQAHVFAVVGEVEVLAAAVGLSARQRAIVALAACAHDVVYQGIAGADESASARWAEQALAGAGISAEVIADVSRLVQATTTHDARADDLAAGVLFDADLAILAAPEQEYDSYSAAVRREYSHLSDDEWRTGRCAVLRGLLGRSSLFHTTPARGREAKARANLRRELDGLEQSFDH